MPNIVSVEVITAKIFEVKGKKVMLDSDLAGLYGVSTKVLIQAVKRNINRFPQDFMYQLTPQDVVNLRSQFVTSRWGGRRYLPYVFTQEGVAMLSSVLNSERAVKVNIQIMRAFVRLRRALLTHKELFFKLNELERKIEKHDVDIRDIFEAIRQLMRLPDENRKITGFTAK